MYQTISAALIVAVVVGVGLYDLMPALYAEDATISHVLRSWSREWPVLAYLWGVLAGHFFLGHEHPVTGSETNDAFILIWTSWTLLILNLFWRDVSTSTPEWIYAALLTLGVVAGHFLWSQV